MLILSRAHGACPTPPGVPTSPALCFQHYVSHSSAETKSLLESSYSVTSLSCSMPCSGILSRRLGGQRSVHIKLPLNIEAGVRLCLVLFKPSTCSKHVEVYSQSLVTTIVFVGLQTFHLARAPRKWAKATLIQLGTCTGTCSYWVSESSL